MRCARNLGQCVGRARMLGEMPFGPRQCIQPGRAGRCDEFDGAASRHGAPATQPRDRIDREAQRPLLQSKRRLEHALARGVESAVRLGEDLFRQRALTGRETVVAAPAAPRQSQLTGNLVDDFLVQHDVVAIVIAPGNGLAAIRNARVVKRHHDGIGNERRHAVLQDAERGSGQNHVMIEERLACGELRLLAAEPKGTDCHDLVVEVDNVERCRIGAEQHGGKCFAVLKPGTRLPLVQICAPARRLYLAVNRATRVRAETELRSVAEIRSMHARFLIAIATSHLLVGSTNVSAHAPQGGGSSLVEQFRCGHALLADALSVHGGEARISGLTQIEFTLSGPSSNAYQGYLVARVDDPEPDGTFRLQGAFDFASGRYWQTNEQRLRGGLDLSFDIVASGGTVINVRNAPRTYTVTNAPAADAAAAQAYDFPARFLPPLLLRRARDNVASVRCEPGSSGERVLAFNWDARTRYRLVMAPDGSVGELRVLQPDALEGETEILFTFSGRQQIDGLVLPQRVVLVRRRAPQFTMTLTEVVVNRSIAQERFSAPRGYVELKEPPGLWHEKIADGLWEVRGLGGGLYRTAVVEATDFLVVFDAPLTPTVARQVLAHIREKISAKAVRYVVLSHFHTDHSAGLPAYAEAGATILLTPSDEPFVRRLLGKRTRMLVPVAQAAASDPAIIRVVDSRFEIPIGPGVAMEVIRFGGSPHVGDMLLAVHSPSGSVFQADLFSTLTPFNETYAHFADWLERTLPDAKLVVGVHHDPVAAATVIDLARAHRGEPAGRQQ